MPTCYENDYQSLQIISRGFAADGYDWGTQQKAWSGRASRQRGEYELCHPVDHVVMRELKLERICIAFSVGIWLGIVQPLDQIGLVMLFIQKSFFHKTINNSICLKATGRSLCLARAYEFECIHETKILLNA